ncbi:MAG: PhnD/SsuA/transferrin family substrate-binding protein [Anaerolineales bacterium]|nr:PhnD/SsuA/transferrin family substrate-binding protein [Anaerolineales bacterium]
MGEKARLRFVVVLIYVLITSCTPSQEAINATDTRLAVDVFATQTAQAPSATPEPTARPPISAAEVFEASMIALEQAETYHFDMDMRLGVEDEEFGMAFPFKFVGDFQFPDNMVAIMSMTLMGLEINLEMISLDGMMYATNPETGEWEVESESVSPMDPALTARIDRIDKLDFEVVTIETLEGIEVYHLMGTIPAEEVSEMVGELRIDYWIGVEDSLPRKITLEGEVESEDLTGLTEGALGFFEMTMTILLSDFGKMVSIKPPEIRTVEQIDSPFGRMNVYESQLYPFSIQYPSGWVTQPVPPLVTARFTSLEGDFLDLAEEDLTALGYEKLTIEEYRQLVLSGVGTFGPDLELVSQNEFTTQSGISGEVMAFATADYKSRRFYYLRDGHLAFNATYIVPIEKFAELEPMIMYSFSTFDISDRWIADDIGTQENPIIWGFAPYGEIEQAREDFETLAALIHEETGLVIEAFVTSKYEDIVEAMCADPPEAHMSSLAVFSYLIATERGCAQAELVAVLFGSTTYNGQIFVRSDSGLESLTDLKGKTFCRMNEFSTSSWVVPNMELEAVGVTVAPIDTGTNNAAVEGVYTGRCDAGGSYVDARRSIEDDYPDVLDVIEVIHVTVGIPHDGVQYHPKFPIELRGQISKAMLKIAETETGEDVFRTIFFWQGLEAHGDSFYDPIRQLLDAAGG